MAESNIADSCCAEIKESFDLLADYYLNFPDSQPNTSIPSTFRRSGYQVAITLRVIVDGKLFIGGIHNIMEKIADRLQESWLLSEEDRKTCITDIMGPSKFSSNEAIPIGKELFMILPVDALIPGKLEQAYFKALKVTESAQLAIDLKKMKDSIAKRNLPQQRQKRLVSEILHDNNLTEYTP